MYFCDVRVVRRADNDLVMARFRNGKNRAIYSECVMKKIIFCAVAILPAITFAAGPDIAVPNTPANGDVADATKLNANFDYLEDILSFTTAKGHNFTISSK